MIVEKLKLLVHYLNIKPVDLPFFNINKKKYSTEKPNNQLKYIDINNSKDNKLNLLNYLKIILKDISVGSKTIFN